MNERASECINGWVSDRVSSTLFLSVAARVAGLTIGIPEPALAVAHVAQARVYAPVLPDVP